MKKILVSITFGTLLAVATQTHAGSLAFMPNTNGAASHSTDYKQIASAFTTVVTANGTSSLVLTVRDEDQTDCVVLQSAFPGVDLANLSINVLKPNVNVLCKLSDSQLPTSGHSAIAESIELGNFTAPGSR